jgi:murein L,D-transpeptidase YcbB/YkuD
MRALLTCLVFVLLLLGGGDVRADRVPEIARLVQGLAGRDAAVSDFYRQRNFTPAWRDEDATALIAILAHAVEEGLERSSYLPIAGHDPDSRDVGLTRAALDYLHDVREGRAFLRTLDSDVGLPESSYDASADLNEAINTHSLTAYLRDAPPPGLQYARLRSALAAYRAIQQRGGWPTISMKDAGLRDSLVALRLRDRLAIEDPASTADIDLAAALKRFQSRHGLEPDGRLGSLTLAALNVTAGARAGQILANMERWRWLPRTFESDYLAINVPDASLSLDLGGKEIFASRVVVGKPETPTPILRAEGGGMTVNPPWNVPSSIARKEILPKLKANPSYLRSQDMVLLNGPEGDPYGLRVRWRDIPKDSFPYLIQQHPGARNPLGTIKLELPNRFDVYVHDTPSKNAFSRPGRAVSHGCVRVERILPLASYVLTQNLEAMMTIANAISSGETQYLPLQRRLPVYFLYWTAFTSKDGALQLRPDIYGRDQRLLAALPEPAKVDAGYPNCSRG